MTCWQKRRKFKDYHWGKRMPLISFPCDRNNRCSEALTWKQARYGGGGGMQSFPSARNLEAGPVSPHSSSFPFKNQTSSFCWIWLEEFGLLKAAIRARRKDLKQMLSGREPLAGSRETKGPSSQVQQLCDLTLVWVWNGDLPTVKLPEQRQC